MSHSTWATTSDDTRFQPGALGNARPIRRPVLLYRRGYRFFKRAFDLTACVLAAPLILPLFCICAAAVRIDDPGPALFTQLRTGRGGRRFRIYKFRTMVSNADDLKVTYAHLNELQWPDFKIADDPRITRVGRILRKTSLDELPQLINVLKGEMSLVGPRPTSFDLSTYRLWHTERLEVTPGITGLWQVSGRSDLEFDARVRLDVEYIENQSLLLDLKILLKTFAVVFSQRGAY